jgi:hypothetical protein
LVVRTVRELSDKIINHFLFQNRAKSRGRKMYAVAGTEVITYVLDQMCARYHCYRPCSVYGVQFFRWQCVDVL